MCGVVALLAPIERDRRERLVRGMCARLGHRGPDGEGVLSIDRPGGTGGITLGHRRLAIVDLSPAAAQPMRRGPLAISYNGELYNYLEKRDALTARGHDVRWVSQGDTEVLLELIEQRGLPDALDEVNGMFAFALWDERRACLWLGRDRFGEKPLYCLVDGETCIVASELKAVVYAAAELGLAISVDRQVLACYLADREYEVGDATFFRSVKRIAPGEVWRIAADSGRLQVGRALYYELSPERCPPDSGPGADRRFVELLADSLRLRLRSDVPVGACLSGGLDSSSLVCLAHQQGHDLTTFSAIHRPGEPCDERRYIDAVVAHTGVTSHRVDPSDVLTVDAFTRFVAHHDEPLGGPSVFAQHAVYGLVAARKVPVTLSGQGADECLSGYRGALPALHAELVRRRAVRALGRELTAAQPDAPWRLLLPAVRLAARRSLPREIEAPWQRFRWRQSFRQPSPFRLDALGPPPEPPPESPHLAAFMRRSLLHGYLYSLLTGSSLATILRYEDRNSMAASVEARAPFLDPRIVEHCLGRPVTELVADGLPKALLRRALGPILPEAVRLRRDKVGFAAPGERWLVGPLRPLVLEILGSRSMRERGLFDVAALRRQYAAAESGIPFDSHALWKAVNVELWLRHHGLSV